MSWTDIIDWFGQTGSDTLDFFSDLGAIMQSMLASMNRATIYLDSISFTDSILGTYLGYFRFMAGDILFFTLMTGAQISLGIVLWKLLLQGVGYVKMILPW